jgi:hypothetical protein
MAQGSDDIGRRILMIDLCRRALCAGLAGLLFFSLTAICLADPSENKSMNAGNVTRICPSGEEGIACRQDAGFPMGVPVEVMQSGRGFAFKGSESHVLRLNVEALQHMEPNQIRSMMALNKSLEEIRSEILADKGGVTYRGSLMLDKSIYPLTGVEAISDNDSTMLNAHLTNIEVASYGGDNSIANETMPVGSISMTISPSNGSMIGKGELELREGPQAGLYAILLEMESHRREKDMKHSDHSGQDQ